MKSPGQGPFASVMASAEMFGDSVSISEQGKWRHFRGTLEPVSASRHGDGVIAIRVFSSPADAPREVWKLFSRFVKSNFRLSAILSTWEHIMTCRHVKSVPELSGDSFFACSDFRDPWPPESSTSIRHRALQESNCLCWTRCSDFASALGECQGATWFCSQLGG